MKQTKLILIIYRESTPTILDSITLATVFPQKRPSLNGYKRKIMDTSKIEFYKKPKTTNFKVPEEFDWRDSGAVTEVF